MFRKILVPLDGSARAENALAYALALAQPASGEVLLLRVPDADLQDSLVPAIIEQDARWQEADAVNLAAMYLDRLVQKYGYLGLALQALVQEGDPSSIILNLAEDEGVDLIVMAPRGVTGLTRLVFGSVTERVLRAAPCPVLVAREPEPSPGVIITLDGSPLAERAIGAGLGLARLFSWPVTLLRVEAPRGDDVNSASVYTWRASADAGAPGVVPVPHAAVADYLDRVARRHAGRDIDIRCALALGSAAERILGFAESAGGGLLVMATHGRTGLQRWVYGSVTEKVMQGTERSLLIVRALQTPEQEEASA